MPIFRYEKEVMNDEWKKCISEIFKTSLLKSNSKPKVATSTWNELLSCLGKQIVPGLSGYSLPFFLSLSLLYQCECVFVCVVLPEDSNLCVSNLQLASQGLELRLNCNHINTHTICVILSSPKNT